MTVVVASIIVFLLMAVLPGDPAKVALGVQATPAELERQRHLMGLDVPIWIQYLHWFGGVVTGHFGTSYVSGDAIGPAIFDALQVTAILVLTSIVIALLFAIPLGTLAAMRHKHIDGGVISAASQIGVALPTFLAGAILIAIFAVIFGVLPAGGWVAPGDNFGAFVLHLILPAFSLACVQGSVLTRYVRSSVLEIMRDDFIRTARSKGLSVWNALMRHGLRNAAIPVMTVAGVQLAALLIGAVPVERVFVIPGLGNLLLDKVSARDLPAVQSIVMVLVIAVLLINLLVDVAATIVDPRLRKTA